MSGGGAIIGGGGRQGNVASVTDGELHVRTSASSPGGNVTIVAPLPLPVDIAAQSLSPIVVNHPATLDVDIVAQSLSPLVVNHPATLDVDVVAQSMAGNFNVDIAEQSVGNVDIDIAAQTASPLIVNHPATLDVDLVAQSLGDVSVDVAAQSVGNFNIDIAEQSLPVVNVNVTSPDPLPVEVVAETRTIFDASNVGEAIQITAVGPYTLIHTVPALITQHIYLFFANIGTLNAIAQIRIDGAPLTDEIHVTVPVGESVVALDGVPVVGNATGGTTIEVVTNTLSGGAPACSAYGYVVNQ